MTKKILIKLMYLCGIATSTVLVQVSHAQEVSKPTAQITTDSAAKQHKEVNKASTPKIANSQLSPVSISYIVSIASNKYGNATLGKLETSLKPTSTGYTVFSKTKAQGFAAILLGSDLHESCDFKINNNQVVSLSYQGGKKKTDSYKVNFNWPQRKVSFNDSELLDMPKGYFVDNCNLPFAIALSKGKDLDKQTIFVVEGKSKLIRGYVLDSVNDEQLNTKIGRYDTTKVVLHREFKPSRKLAMWLAKDHQYLPIKIEEIRSSRTTTMLVNKFTNH